MNTPEWMKPAVAGAAAGAIALAVIGFGFSGWVTGGKAEARSATMARAEVVAALTPVCLDIALTDPQRVEKLATIKAASTYQRRDAVMKAGWATMPGSETADRDVAEACLSRLAL